jgi:hypothetical protein
VMLWGHVSAAEGDTDKDVYGAPVGLCSTLDCTTKHSYAGEQRRNINLWRQMCFAAVAVCCSVEHARD